MKQTVGLFILAILQVKCQSGILYPRSNSVRELLPLDGLWKFTLGPVNGYTLAVSIDNYTDRTVSDHHLQEDDEDVELMPVPASYNDISTNPKIRDHVGLVYYQRNFDAPKSWQNKRVWLRFASVCYAAQVVRQSFCIFIKHEFEVIIVF